MAMEAVALGWQAIVVAIVLGISLIIMGLDLIGPDLVFGGMTAIFIVSGILPIKDGAAGFSNTGVLTVMVLYLVAEGVSQTGGLDLAMNFMLGNKTKSVFWAQVRMMIPVMIASAFLNNTPICALMMPILISWGRRSGISPKKLLIPMSFATVLGGTCTIIGTSTNLVVSGLQEEKYGDKNPELVFGFFTITPYGIPYAIWGMAYILLFSKWLLPGDESVGNALTSGLLVPATSPVVGKTATQAGLTGGKLVVSALSRGSSPAVPYTRDTVIAEGDVLFVTGNVDAVDQAADEFGLLLLTSDHDVGPGGMLSAAHIEEGFDSSATSNTASTLVQVRVKKSSPLVGQGVRAVGFRGRFSAAIIAVKRASEVQPGRIGDIVLQPRDVLVLSTATDFNPKSKDFTESFEKLVYLDEALARQFTTTMVVGRRSKEAGKSISDVGLRGINGLFLYQIVREDGTVLKAVDGNTMIEHGDTLKFAGDLDGVNYLLKYTTLEHAQQRHVAKLPSEQIYRRMVQVVVSAHGGLVGQRLRDVHFRQTYGAAVLGLHRAGRPVPGDLADVPLATGDVLVVEAGPEFAHNFKHNRAFSLISEVPNSAPMKRNRMWIALLLTIAMVATQIIGGATKEFIHLWPCAMLTAGAMLLTKCMSAEQARSAVDWEVYTCIAFAFAVSTAMEKTKLAQAIAQLFVGLSRAIGGQTAALSCIYLVTSLLSELLTNNAAAAIMYPIAASAADSLGIHPNIMSVAVMLGGSAGWALPYSYQCNLMVYAAGKYRTKDFVKFGSPFHVWLFAGVILILGVGDRWIIPLVASLIFTAIVIIVPALYEYALNDAQRAAISRLLPGGKKKAHGSSDALLPLAPSGSKSNGSFNGTGLMASKDVDVAPHADIAARR